MVTGTGFTLGPNGCTSTIPPAGTCQASVIFTPPSKGKFKGSDWTMKSSMGILGFSAQTEPSWWDFFENIGCSGSKPVYCLEP